VEVNSLGLRGPEVDRVKPPGVYRIGVFGDSATFGQGVSEEATYARVLERTNRGVQVLNFGVPSYSIANIVSTFAEKGVPLDLDAAVLAPISEDYGLHRAHTTDDYGYPVHAASPIKPGPLKNLLRHVHLAYLVRDAWWNMTGAGTPEIRALHENSGDDALATETWDRAARELARFVAVARANGVVPIYMAIGWPMPPVLERLVSDSGFMKLVAMQPIAASYPPEALKVSSRDDHPSALYHQLVAKELGRVVSELRQKTVADGKSTKEN
jgi:hypothetical protein